MLRWPPGGAFVVGAPGPRLADGDYGVPPCIPPVFAPGQRP